MCSSIWNAIVNVFFFCCPALSHLIWPPMKFVFSVSGVEHAKRLCQMWFTWFMLNDLLMSRSNHWRAHFIRSNWYAFLSLITLMPPATSMMVHWISFRIEMKMKEAKKREKKKHHWPQTIRHLIRRNQRKRNLTKKKKKKIGTFIRFRLRFANYETNCEAKPKWMETKKLIKKQILRHAMECIGDARMRIQTNTNFSSIEISIVRRSSITDSFTIWINFNFEENSSICHWYFVEFVCGVRYVQMTKRPIFAYQIKYNSRSAMRIKDSCICLLNAKAQTVHSLIQQTLADCSSIFNFIHETYGERKTREGERETDRKKKREK